METLIIIIGCLRPSDFNRSVCNGVDSSGSSGSGSGMKENGKHCVVL